MKDVLDAVESLSSQWSFLSLNLGVKQSSLDTIEHNHPGDAKTCLYKALGEWLRQNYDHQRHGGPSWRRLAEALQTLDNSVFKKIIETKGL
jgi:3-methyladenine DNA glycosylase AlkD